MFSKFIIFVSALFYLTSFVQAADIELFTDEEYERTVVRFSGGIIKGDLQKLQSVIANNQTKDRIDLYLNSRGGLVKEALDIGKYIRQHGFRTVIADECYSACFFIFIAGVERKSYGELGVHQFYGGQGRSDYVEYTTQLLMAQLLDYTTSMGVDIETIKIASQTPPEDMYIFTQEEMERFGIYAQRNLRNIYEEKLALLETKESADSIKWFQHMAAEGDAMAQFHLGEMYEQGLYVKRNYKEAAKWIQAAADQAHAQAQCRLVFFYINGWGVEKSIPKAKKWYQAAADQANACGQYNIGVMYADGRGVKQDYVEARRWYFAAAR